MVPPPKAPPIPPRKVILDDEYSLGDEDTFDTEDEETSCMSYSEEATLEEECRRNLFNLTNIRIFHVDTTRMLYTHFGHIAIQHAAMRNDAELVERCFAHGDSSSLRLNRLQEGWPSPVGRVGGTVLHAAVHAGNVDLVKTLLDNGCDIQIRAEVDSSNGAEIKFCSYSRFKLSPLGLSLALGRRAISRILLDRGASTSVGFGIFHPSSGQVRELYLFNAAHVAAISDDGEIMETLLQQDGVSPDSPDRAEYTPLHWATCAPKGLGNVKTLVDAGADIRSQNFYQPLLLDILPRFCGKPEEFEAVFRMAFTTEAQANIRVNQTGPSGVTPLGRAASHLNVETMRLYLQHGANPDLGSNAETSPLSLCLKAHEELNSRNFDMKVAETGLAAVKLIFNASLRVDHKLVFQGMLKANLGFAKEFLLKLKPHFIFSHEELGELFVHVGSQDWKVNTSFTFLMEHFLPTDPALLDRWPVFGRLLTTPSIRDPDFLKLMGPSFDPNCPDYESGSTPFLATLKNAWCPYSSRHHIVEALLRQGANVNARERGGETCLSLYYSRHIWSVGEGNHNLSGESMAESTQSFCALARKLAEHGYDFNARNDWNGRSILHMIASDPAADLRGECVETLIALGADVTIQDDNGQTILEIYQRGNCFEFMKRHNSIMRGSFGHAIRAALSSMA